MIKQPNGCKNECDYVVCRFLSAIICTNRAEARTLVAYDFYEHARSITITCCDKSY